MKSEMSLALSSGHLQDLHLHVAAGGGFTRAPTSWDVHRVNEHKVCRVKRAVCGRSHPVHKGQRQPHPARHPGGAEARFSSWEDDH